MFRSVDFPEPDGPTIETISPLSMRRLTPLSAVTSCLASNRLTTSFS